MKCFLILLACFFSLNASAQFLPSEEFDLAVSTNYSEMADLDSDGYPDIIYALQHHVLGLNSVRIVWQRNNGAGLFSEPEILFSTSIEFLPTGDLILGDYDQDGDNDVIYAGSIYTLSESYWFFENHGDASFEEPVEIGIIDDNEIPDMITYNAWMDDVDNDGDQDILAYYSMSSDYILHWSENDGSGNLSAPQVIHSTALPEPLISQYADMNGDGFKDIVMPLTGLNNLYWYPNSETGLATNYEDLLGVNDLQSYRLIDADQDGDMDVIYANLAYTSLFYLENHGDGSFEPAVDLGPPPGAFFGNDYLNKSNSLGFDFTGDGISDMVFQNTTINNNLSFRVFPGLPGGGFGAMQVISTVASPTSSNSLFQYSDVDMDGDMDIIISSGSNLVVLHNSGGGSFDQVQRINIGSFLPGNFKLCDLDGSNGTDVITQDNSSQSIRCLSIQWDPYNSEIPQSSVTGHTNLTYQGIECIDLNMDGLKDVVYYGYSGAQRRLEACYALGDHTFSATTTLFSFSSYTAFAKFMDINNDGLMDLVRQNGNQDLELYQHSGANGLELIHTSPLTGFIADITAADLDQDGLTDLLFSWASASHLRVLTNLGGGNYSAQTLQLAGFNGAFGKVQCGDLNSDEWPDLLFTFTGALGAAFGSEFEILNSAQYLGYQPDPDQVIFTDLHGDGFMDVYSSDYESTRVLGSDGNGGFIALEIADHADTENLFPLDLDLDGAVDIISNYDAFGNLTWRKNAQQPCEDPDACNYNSDPIPGPEPCCYGTCGCTQPSASNYDPNADCDNGSCLFDIEGTVFLDSNSNGIFDPEETPYFGHEVLLMPNNITAITNEDGYFQFADLSVGSVELSAAYSEAYPFFINPNPQTINIGNGTPPYVYFGLSDQVEQPIYNLEVDLFSYDSGCDEPVNHVVCLHNQGNTAMDVLIEIQQDAIFQGFVEVFPLDSIVADTAYVTFIGFQPADYQCFNIDLVAPSVEFIEEVLSANVVATGMIDGAQVIQVSDLFERELACAYDPNDKQVFPNGYAEPHFILNDTELEYLVRFQNTGNAPATDVIIVDTLDVNLNLSSLQLRASSHNALTHVDPVTRRVEFLFENIMLPDSTSDLEASQGFVLFSVDLEPGLEAGIELNNQAFIYFDNNPPILTNTTWNTIYECTDDLASIEEEGGSVCLGEEIQLSSFQDYVETNSWWIDNEVIGIENTLNYTPQESGTISIVHQAENPLCIATDVVEWNVFELPEALITQTGDNEYSAGDGSSYQWYLNGEAIEGATSQDIMITEEGLYSVEVTNEAGCSETSAEVLLTPVGMIEHSRSPLQLFPNPVKDKATLIFSEYCEDCRISIHDNSGRIVFSEIGISGASYEISTINWMSGGYLLQVHTINGEMRAVSFMVE